MDYLWTTIHVNNMNESVKFYETLIELPIIKRFSTEDGMEIAFLGKGQTQIELICDSNIKAEINERGISLGFKVDSLDSMKELIDKKGIFSTPIIQPNPGIKYFFIDDPDGISIQFVEVIKN